MSPLYPGLGPQESAQICQDYCSRPPRSDEISGQGLHSPCIFISLTHTHSTSLANFFFPVMFPHDSTLKIAIICVENKVFPVV